MKYVEINKKTHTNLEQCVTVPSRRSLCSHLQREKEINCDWSDQPRDSQ